MAQKNDNKIIFWILGLGTIGYGVYAWWKSKKDATPTTPTYTPPEVDVVSGKTYTPYERRVMVLQQLLGVAIDGKAGMQTNTQLKEFYRGKLSDGDVSPTNIEKYISAMSNKTTPYHLEMKAQAMADSVADNKAKSERIVLAYNQNVGNVIQLNPNKAVGGNFQVYEVSYNTATSEYEKVGTLIVPAGRKTRDGYLPKAYYQKYNALVMRINKGGVYAYIMIDPNFVQVVP